MRSFLIITLVVVAAGIMLASCELRNPIVDQAVETAIVETQVAGTDFQAAVNTAVEATAEAAPDTLEPTATPQPASDGCFALDVYSAEHGGPTLSPECIATATARAQRETATAAAYHRAATAEILTVQVYWTLTAAAQ